MRLLKTKLTFKEFEPHIQNILPRLQLLISSGVKQQTDELLKADMNWMVQHGYGTIEDLKNVKPATDKQERTPPTSNESHIVEIKYIEQIFDPKTACDFNLQEGQVVIIVKGNNGIAKRQLITHQLRLGFEDIFGTSKGHINIIYDGPAEFKATKLKPIATIK